MHLLLIGPLKQDVSRYGPKSDGCMAYGALLSQNKPCDFTKVLMIISKRNCLLIAGSFAFTSLITLGHAKGLIATVEMEAGIKQCTGSSRNYVDCARGIEKKTIKKPGTLAKRAGKVLIITAGTKKITFKDSGSDNEKVVYSYLGINPVLHTHVIHIQAYEFSSYILVQQESGLETDVFGFPIASSDGKNFAASSEGISAGNGDTDQNNVSIWSTEGGKIVQVAELKGMAWGPDALTWTPEGLRVNKICANTSTEDSYDVKPCGSANIIKTTGIWKLLNKPIRP